MKILIKKSIILLVRFILLFFIKRKIAIIDIGINKNILKDFFYTFLKKDEYKLIHHKKNFSKNDYDEKIKFYFGLFTFNNDIPNTTFIMLIENPEIYNSLLFDKIIKKKKNIQMDIFEKSFNDNLITRFIIDKYPNRSLGINEELTIAPLDDYDFSKATKNLKNHNLKVIRKDSLIVRLIYFILRKKYINEQTLLNEISEKKIKLKEKITYLDKKIYKKIQNSS